MKATTQKRLVSTWTSCHGAGLPTPAVHPNRPNHE